MYIFWFLHQTTTFDLCPNQPKSCISFDSYIKPQQWSHNYRFCWVVYLLIPTSNHNFGSILNSRLMLYIFWFLHQTTTIQLKIPSVKMLYIFWFLHQTTTRIDNMRVDAQLYIFWFLHQTTTSTSKTLQRCCCISFDSYIKPQLNRIRTVINGVVYLLIPTSNHNL